ncbi:sulfotransferase ssu-1-like [Ornithodoros turicata]|uniref:sulfotransferase ssu-1-like n=1 Tax=Ornithodoros turicata TaxID=34597 RepID=UPI003139A97C
MPRERFHIVDGIFLGKHFSEESVREVLAYEPRPDDVFVVTYPKCGTTWMQHIVYYIFSNGTPPKDSDEFDSKTPFFEYMGQEAVDNLPRPAAIKTHLAFNKQPYSKDAKYIYVARNPFDCCISFFHHVRFFPMYDYEDGTFDEFFEEFLRGEVDFGDYFDHLLSWYPHRHDPNVLFLTFEDLKNDTRTWIQKVADFLGKEYGERLRNEPEVMEKILQYTSVEYMKKTVNPVMTRLDQKFQGLPRDQWPRWAQRFLRGCGDLLQKQSVGTFVRKGEVGDYKTELTQDQVKRMKEYIAKRTAGTDVMGLWKNLKWME